MLFEIFYKSGRGWSRFGTVNAVDSKVAARWAYNNHRKGVIGVRPDGCNDAVKLFVYRFGKVAKKI